MTVGTVVFVRHGRTRYNAAMRLQGQVDIELDEVGQWQAKAGAQALVRSVKPTRIVASDLVRAHETAQEIAVLTGLTVSTDVRLRERGFGPWEGLMRPEIQERWPNEFAKWAAGLEPGVEGLETKATVAQRMLEAITDLGSDLGQDDTLVLVSHGAAITCTLAALFDQDPATWRGMGGLQNVHWSTVARNVNQDMEPRWRLIEHNAGLSAQHGSQAWADGLAN